jgi:hypothetical protein
MAVDSEPSHVSFDPDIRVLLLKLVPSLGACKKRNED